MATAPNLTYAKNEQVWLVVNPNSRFHVQSAYAMGEEKPEAILVDHVFFGKETKASAYWIHRNNCFKYKNKVQAIERLKWHLEAELKELKEKAIHTEELIRECDRAALAASVLWVNPEGSGRVMKDGRVQVENASENGWTYTQSAEVANKILMAYVQHTHESK